MWCDLILWPAFEPGVFDSMTSGYSVPCTRNRTFGDLLRLFFEDGDELVADRDALQLGIVEAREPFEKARRRIDVHDVEVQDVAERRDDAERLVLAHQAGVDVDARELLADRARHQRRGDRGVDAAGERAEHVGVADLRAHLLDRVVDPRVHLPRRRDARDRVQEILEDRGPGFGVHDFRMEQHGVPLVRVVGHRGDRATSTCARARVNPGGTLSTESPCDIHTRDARGTPRNSGESLPVDDQLRRTELAVAEPHEPAAEALHHQLHAVADARAAAARCRTRADRTRARRRRTSTPGRRSE